MEQKFFVSFFQKRNALLIFNSSPNAARQRLRARKAGALRRIAFRQQLARLLQKGGRRVLPSHGVQAFGARQPQIGPHANIVLDLDLIEPAQGIVTRRVGSGNIAAQKLAPR